LWFASFEVGEEPIKKSATPFVLAVGKRFGDASSLVGFRGEFEAVTPYSIKFSGSSDDDDDDDHHRDYDDNDNDQDYDYNGNDYSVESSANNDDEGRYEQEITFTVGLQWTAMVNGFADLRINDTVSPYLGLGVGYASHKLKMSAGSESIEGTSMGFAYQIMGGVVITPHRHFSIDLGYKYTDYGTVSVSFDDDDTEYKAKSSGLYIGANYIF
jgi:opacity protein-like surface antigen